MKSQGTSSFFGFGSASLSGEGKGYGFGAIKEEEAIALVQMAYDRGVRLFDTAPIYGFGLAERRLGMGLKRHHDAQIISKSGVGWHENGRVDMDNDPKKTLKMLEDSLRRLKREVIDTYLIHWPDDKWDIRYPMEVLSQAKAQGKIKAIGLSNTNASDFSKALEIDEIEMVQFEHNLYTQEKWLELKDVIDGLLITTWGTLDKGLLVNISGEERQYDEFDARRSAPWWKKSIVEKKLAKTKLWWEEWGAFRLKNNLPPLTNLDLLAMATHFPAFSVKDAHSPLTPLVGVKSREQLENLLSLETARYSPEEFELAKKILQTE